MPLRVIPFSAPITMSNTDCHSCLSQHCGKLLGNTVRQGLRCASQGPNLYGQNLMKQVTNFLGDHPGGARIILKMAGKDCTEEYDPIHPPGTLEEELPSECFLGTIDTDSIPKPAAEAVETTTKEKAASDEPPPMSSLLNLDEIEEVATQRLSKKAWAYYFSASDDLYSKSFNNQVYRNILLRPRVFVNCENAYLDTSILGNKLSTPIYVSPAAMARLAHPAGEAGIAEACREFGAAQIISNNASMTPEQIVANAAPDQVFGWQLYCQIDVQKSEKMLARVNALPNIKFIVLTLDAPVPGKREDDERSKNVAEDLPATSALVSAAGGTPAPAGGGIGQQLFAGTDPRLTWKTTLPWLAKHTKLPIVLKGLQTHEDAHLAAQYAPQVQGIILSNHGGRALDTAPPALHTLLEIRKYAPHVFDKIEVLVDGGIKRGTDVVKALALGAKGVGIGRAALFGLGAGGPEGVKRVMEILRDETLTSMRLLGVQRVEELGPHHVSLNSYFFGWTCLLTWSDRSMLGRSKRRFMMVLRRCSHARLGCGFLRSCNCIFFFSDRSFTGYAKSRHGSWGVQLHYDITSVPVTAISKESYCVRMTCNSTLHIRHGTAHEESPSSLFLTLLTQLIQVPHLPNRHAPPRKHILMQIPPILRL